MAVPIEYEVRRVVYDDMGQNGVMGSYAIGTITSLDDANAIDIVVRAYMQHMSGVLWGKAAYEANHFIDGHRSYIATRNEDGSFTHEVHGTDIVHEIVPVRHA